MAFTFAKLLSIGIVVAFATSTQTVNGNFYLVALAGQSNMTGEGDVNDLPLDFPKNGTRLWKFINANTWALAKEPVHERSGVGPALAMADAFASQNPHVNVGLIPCAKDSSRIAQWQRDLSRSTLYGSCLYRQKLAEQQGKVRALVFWQGGGDGKDKEAADSWAENFKKMVTAWRADLGDPNLQVIMLVLKPGTKKILKRNPYRDVVRQQQLSVQLPHLTKIETVG
jgi:hypothetical protein